MSKKENRRYPRVDHVTSQQILHIDNLQTPHRKYVLTQDMSACGIRFTSNENIEPATCFLIYLNDELLHDLSRKSKNWFKLGDYYLAKVIWTQEIHSRLFEIGAGFIERTSCSVGDLDTFTELVNLDMLESLPEVSVAH